MSIAREFPDPDLVEQGRRYASRRDDLVAHGVDPRDLLVPVAPEGGQTPAHVVDADEVADATVAAGCECQTCRDLRALPPGEHT